MSEELTPATFADAVDTTFALETAAADQALELTLASLVVHSPSPGAPRDEPFSLTFVGAPGQHLPQGTYQLRHAALGTLEIFLVPIGPAADGRHQYEAAFN